MAEYRDLSREQSSATSNRRGINRLTPVALMNARSFMIDRASWTAVNQVTTKKMVKMMRKIRAMAREKLPSTKWAGDRVGGVEGPDITLISSSLAEVPADLSESGTPGLIGFPG